MKVSTFLFLTIFHLTIAGCNLRGPNLVDLIMEEEPGAVVSSTAPRTFPTPLEIGETFEAVFSSEAGRPSWETITCTFDQLVDGAVVSGTDCTSLPGYPATTFSGAVLRWTPNRAAWGPYEIAIRATTPAGRSATLVLVNTVRPAYPVAKLRGDWSAQFASGIAPYAAANLQWTDLTGNRFHGTLSDALQTSWLGTSGFSNPYALSLSGSGKVTFDPGLLQGQTQMAFQTWLNPTEVSAKGTVVVSNSGNGAGSGFSLRQSYRPSGGYELSLGQSYQDAVLAAGPIGYWRLNEPSGSTAYDISGRENHGTYSGGGFTLADPGGLVGDSSGAALFNGTTSHVSISGTTDFHVGNSMTISMWIRPTGLGVRRALFSNRTPTDPQVFNFEAGPGNFGVNRLGLTTPLNWDAETGNNVVTDSVWQHVAYTRSGATQRIYVNGVSQALIVDVPVAFADNLLPHYIGFDPRVSSYYSGHMSDVALFNYPLSNAEILYLYQAGQGLYGGICYSTSTPSSGVWNMLGGIFDGINASLFVNGAPECTVAAPASGFTPSAESLIAGSTASGASPWKGKMGELRIYGTSDGSAASSAQDQYVGFDATADRFREVPVGGIVSSGLVFHVDAANANKLLAHANGCASLSFYDLSSTLLTGTLTGFAGCGASSGWLGSVSTSNPHRLKFDGVDDFVSFPHSSALDLATAFSVGGWIRSSTLATHPNADLATKAGWWAFSIGLPGAGQIRLTDGGTNGAYATTPLASSAWNHVMAVKAGSALSSISIYVNGSPVTTQPLGATWSNATGATTTTLGGGSSGSFNGEIGQWTVYNRALSSAEVNEACKSARSRFAGATCQ